MLLYRLPWSNNDIIDVKDNFGQTPLSWAARKGHAEVTKVLLGTKANVEATDTDKRTPLNWAARNGHGNVVELLARTRHGANPGAHM